MFLINDVRRVAKSENVTERRACEMLVKEKRFTHFEYAPKGMPGRGVSASKTSGPSALKRAAGALYRQFTESTRLAHEMAARDPSFASYVADLIGPTQAK
jgi:hypothetical protein